MIHLSVLGRVDLRSEDGNPVGSVLSQPRRLALLVFLAVESRGGELQRDHLMGVFWPDQSQDQARQSLRTALHFLRRSLGSGAFVGHGTALALNPEVVTSDAAEFEAALEAGDLEGALRRYVGDLLPGFFLDAAPPEFERWLDATRGRLRRAAADAAWALAGTELGRDNEATAGAWARRAAQLFEGDEVASRRSMELLHRIGDRAGALAVYESLSRRLKEEFDASPSPETLALAALVRGESAADRLPAPTPVTSDSNRTQPAQAPWRRGAGGLVRAALVAGIAGAVLILGYVVTISLRTGEAPFTESPRGSVIYVEELRDFSNGRSSKELAGALTMELMGRLSESDVMRVVSLAGDGAPSGSGPQPGFVVRGGVVQSDTLVRVTAILLESASGATLNRISAETRSGEPTAVTEALAESLSRTIRRQVGRAVEDHHRGLASTNKGALTRVRAAIRDMAAADSLFRLGAVDVSLVALAAADSQLMVAQSLAPDWSEPAIQRAEVALRQMWRHLLPPLRDMETVARSLQEGVTWAERAVVIAPEDPAALEIRGLLNYWLWLTRSTKTEAGLREALARAETDLRQATQLDPGRARAWSALSALYEQHGDFAAANLAARRAMRADPYLAHATETVVRLFTTSLEIGDTGAAHRWCEELGRRVADSWVSSHCVLELLAWTGPPAGVDVDSIRRMVGRAQTAHPDFDGSHRRLELLGAISMARAGEPDAAGVVLTAPAENAPEQAELLVMEAWLRLVLGEKDAAVSLLARASEASPRMARMMLLSRRFEALRGDPRIGRSLAALP